MSEPRPLIEIVDGRVIDRTTEAQDRAAEEETGALYTASPDCRHMRVSVDAVEREVRCRDCRAWLFAFDVLLDYANQERRLRERRRLLREQASELEAQVKELKRDERNTRARLKRLKAKDP